MRNHDWGSALASTVVFQSFLPRSSRLVYSFCPPPPPQRLFLTTKPPQGQGRHSSFPPYALHNVRRIVCSLLIKSLSLPWWPWCFLFTTTTTPKSSSSSCSCLTAGWWFLWFLGFRFNGSPHSTTKAASQPVVAEGSPAVLPSSSLIPRRRSLLFLLFLLILFPRRISS